MDDRTRDRTATGAGLTRSLAARAQAVRHELLSSEARQLARQCMLDYVAVTLAGASEPLAAMVLAEMEEQGGAPSATVFLHGGRLPVLSAALVNGTASHALDYDDVNLAMPGHPTVAIMPALLALAEETHASGADLIAAFVAGYELQCRAGLLVAPAHYDHGLHATGTIGAFGAAAACAHLMKLDAQGIANALGIAGTQAAGLRSLFGTMCKPFHAGKASHNGALNSGLLSTINAGGVALTGSGMNWQLALIVGFAAGFLERLVPDLLEKSAPPSTPAATSSAAGGAASASQH